MKKIVIPKVDANIEQGALGVWMVAEGDRVSKHQPLVEYITDKAVYEIDSPASGCLRQIVAPSKSVVPIGFVIGLIGRPGEALPDVTAENRRLLESYRSALSQTAEPVEQPPAGFPGSARPRATPAARRLARQTGIQLEHLQAWHGQGVITVETVTAYTAAQGSPRAGGDR